MKVYVRLLIAAIMLSLAVGVLAAPFTERVTVPKGTIVNLVFDQPLTSKTAKAGQTVRLHVRDNVRVGAKTVIRKGTRVTGVLTEVKHKQRFGVNAKIPLRGGVL